MQWGKRTEAGLRLGTKEITFVDGVEVRLTDRGDKDLGGGRGDGEKWAEVKSVFKWNERTQ